LAQFTPSTGSVVNGLNLTMAVLLSEVLTVSSPPVCALSSKRL